MNTTKTKLSMILAASDNHVIGIDNKIPWWLPADLAHFKNVTMGKPMIMGRRTFESIGKPLPGRLNIVVTGALADGVTQDKNLVFFNCPDKALLFAQGYAAGIDCDEVMIVGGATLYERFYDQADRIYLTRVHEDFVGDTFFEVHDDKWNLTSESTKEKTPECTLSYTFMTLDKKA